jgi:hypothetical protein
MTRNEKLRWEERTSHGCYPMSGVSMVVLETEPKVKKSSPKVSWRSDAVALVVDEKLVEKSLTFRWDWDPTWSQRRKER